MTFIDHFIGGVPRSVHVVVTGDGEWTRYYTDGKLVAEEWESTGGGIVIRPQGTTTEVDDGRPNAG